MPTTKKTQIFLSAYLPPILWGIVIFFLSAQSSLPSFSTSLTDFIFKKCSHIFVYAVLYFLTYRAVNFRRPASKVKNWRLPLLLCILYATTDEVHQAFTPHRSSSIRDVGYDFLGAGLAFLKMYRYI